MTDELRDLFESTLATSLNIGSYNSNFGDPHHKVVKTLTVEYEIGGERKIARFEEDARIELD